MFATGVDNLLNQLFRKLRVGFGDQFARLWIRHIMGDDFSDQVILRNFQFVNFFLFEFTNVLGCNPSTCLYNDGLACFYIERRCLATQTLGNQVKSYLGFV